MPGTNYSPTEEMARADALAVAAGVPGLTLMEAAGRAVADGGAPRWCEPGARVVVLCGPGNNGGDGFVAARLLRRAAAASRRPARRLARAARATRPTMAARWTGDESACRRRIFAAADLIIDALFGAGLSRPLDGLAAALVEAVNAARQAGARRRRAERPRRQHRQPRGAVVQADAHRHLLPPQARSPAACRAARCAARSRLADIGIPRRGPGRRSRPNLRPTRPALWLRASTLAARSTGTSTAAATPSWSRVRPSNRRRPARRPRRPCASAPGS